MSIFSKANMPKFIVFQTFMALPGVVILAAAIFLANPVLAGFEGPGTQPTVTSAASALRAEDDAPCLLEGKITAKITSRKNRYIFVDETGQIVVEISKKTFGNLTVTPMDTVRIEGEVDWSSKHPNEIEVDFIQIVPQSDTK